MTFAQAAQSREFWTYMAVGLLAMALAIFFGWLALTERREGKARADRKAALLSARRIEMREQERTRFSRPTLPVDWRR